MVTSKKLPLAEAKAHLAEIVARIESDQSRSSSPRNGRPAAVLLSPDDLEAREDTLDLLSDPAALEEIRTARNDVVKGRGVTAEELRTKYLAK